MTRFSFYTFLLLAWCLPSVVSAQTLGDNLSSFAMTSNGSGAIVGLTGFDVTTPAVGAGYSADWYRDVLQSLNVPPTIQPLPGGMQNAGGWYFVVAGGSNIVDFDSAVNRWTRNGARIGRIAGNTYEIRFTASGGKAWFRFGTGNVDDVPFELWFLANTPNDPSDDVRMIPVLLDNEPFFELGPSGTDVFSFVLDHQADGDPNDPFSDWIYFYMPVDDSPGEAGYDQFVLDAATEPPNLNAGEQEHLARVVLMNWDQHQGESAPGAGDGPVDAVPEIGTTFRISTEDHIAPTCTVATFSGGPPISLEMVIQDEGNGVQSISVAESDNATVTIPSFTPGEMGPIVVAAEIIDQNNDALVVLDVADTAGNADSCDRLFEGIAVHNAGNVVLALQPNSRLGTRRTPYPRDGGTNAFWPITGGIDHLFAGGLWAGAEVAGEKRVMKTEFGTPDWSQTPGTLITHAAVDSDQDIGFTYDDQSAASAPIGLRVHQQSYQWSDPTRDDFIIITYTIENTGESGNLTDVFTALWSDPDVSADAGSDLVGYDAARSMIYQYDAAISPQGGYIGFRVLDSPAHSARDYQNDSGGEPVDDADRFDNFLTGGFPPLGTTPADQRMMITASPFDLDVGETHLVAMGVVMGQDLAELQAHADVMQTIAENELGITPLPRPTVRDINALDPANLATLNLDGPALTIEAITDLIKSSFEGQDVSFTAVLLSEPHNSGLSGVQGDGFPDRIHVFVRDVTAVTDGPEGMTIMVVDSDYLTTGLLDAEPGDVLDIIGTVTYFQTGLQLAPLSVTNLGPFSDNGFPASIMDPVVVTTSDISRDLGGGQVQINWDTFSDLNGQYVRLEGVDVLDRQPDETNGRPSWLMSDDGGATLLESDDLSLRFRNDREAYDDSFNKRSAADGDFVPPEIGVTVNVQGFLAFRSFDKYGHTLPEGANLKLSLWEDTDLDGGPPPIPATVREINALDPANLATLELYDTNLTLGDITNLIKSPFDGQTVQFTAVLLTEPHRSGLSGVDGSGFPRRIHVYVRDVTAATQGLDGMTIQLVDGDYNTTGLINADPGDVLEITGPVTYFNSSIQLSPQTVVNLGTYSSQGLPASILDPVVVTTSDLHTDLGGGQGQINWANFSSLNNQFVRLEGAEVVNQRIDPDRPRWQMSSDGGTTVLQSDDKSLRYRNDRGNYDDSFDKRTGGDFMLPELGAITNVQGFLGFRGFDDYGAGIPSGALFAISPWEDTDLGVEQEEIIIPPEDGDPPPIELPDVGILIDFSELDESVTITVEQFTAPPDELLGFYAPELGGFWTIEQEGATDFIVDLCFSLENLDPATDPTELEMLKRSDPEGPWVPQTTELRPDEVNPTEICVLGLTDFSDFAVVTFQPEDDPDPNDDEDEDGILNDVDVCPFLPDVAAPVIALNSGDPLTVLRFSGPYTDPATATDVFDSEPTLTITGDVDTNLPGSYPVTINAADDCGNIAEATRTVEVINDPDALVCELKVDGKEDRVGKSLHLETFNTAPNLSDLWDTLFGVAPPTTSGGIVTLLGDQVVTWDEGTLVMGGLMKLDVKTDPNDPSVKKVTIKKAGKDDPPTEFVSGFGGVNPNLADGGWHEVKVKNMLDVTVFFDGETVTGLLKELKVKLDENSTTGAPVVKDFKIDITGVTTAADVEKGTVASVEVTIPATTVTARATTEYEEKIKDDPAVLDGHTEAEFKREKDAVTEGVDIASLSDGFNDELKERKGPCSISAASVSAPKQGVRSVESEPQADIPEGYVLEQSYPNPFNPATTIRFSVPEASPVRLVVYDVLGRQVRVLVDGTVLAGVHEVVFEASDLSSGTYLYRLETPQGSFVQTMLLVK